MSFINVDDGDLRIQYSGSWQTMVFDAAYNSTLHYTTEEGATATLVFTGRSLCLLGLHPMLSLPVYRNPGWTYRLRGAHGQMGMAVGVVRRRREDLGNPKGLDGGPNDHVLQCPAL